MGMLFFFSSRRRHTRCYRDWSSDVCSSDLKLPTRFTLGVNLVGSFLTCQAAARRMVARKYGRIVNFASGHWFRPGPGTTAYAASKAGVVMMSRVLAQELAPHGILVNTIAPGLTDTPMTRPSW